MEITPEVRAFALEQAARRCECTGGNCRHHLDGHRCKKGLRGDQWKVYWRKEDGGVTRDNISAWCLVCFGNNFEVPSETVAILAPDITGYARLVAEEPRRAVTIRSVLRDAARDAARKGRGRVVLERLEDDMLIELPTPKDALQTARALNDGFHELANRLDLGAPPLHGAIHMGEVTRWRNGLLVGDALEVASALRSLAPEGQIVVTDPVARELKGVAELHTLEREKVETPAEAPEVSAVWTFTI